MTGPAIIALAAAAGQAVPATPPVTLTATEAGDIVHLKVRGLSAVALTAPFTLQARSGSNRTEQRGVARLAPNHPAEFITLNLSGRAAGWEAVLRVEPPGAAAYEIRLPKP